MKLTMGKLQGLRRVSTSKGIIAAAAMDQRGSLKSAIAAEKGIEPNEVTSEMLSEFKQAVTQVLTPHVSAILLDPEYGLRPSKSRAPNAGLLLAYEVSGYDRAVPGRLPHLLDRWSVRRLKEAGADCVKILLYYAPFDPEPINRIKHAWVERIGAECAAEDMPLFAEFVGYQEGTDNSGVEYARKKPDIVRRTVTEFSKPHYRIDVLKIEVPVSMMHVEGTRAFKGETAYSVRQAKELFQQVSVATAKPFIYLSGDVSNETFVEALQLATDAGVGFSGVLCGRATWLDGVPVYAKKSLSAFHEWLARDGVQNVERVNQALRGAKPWYAFYEVDAATARGGTRS